MMVSSRSIRLPLIISGFNLILAAFALFAMITNLSIARSDAHINYAMFLTIFKYVAFIEFVLMLFTMPALTAGSISGEREHRTLDLMLTTRLTPAKIVAGKMMTSVTTVILMIVSSLPILALIFAYGGVTILDLVLLFIAYLIAAIFSASVGIWASSLSDRSAIATAATYAVMLLFVGGTIGFCYLIHNFMGNAGGWVYVLLINPAATFYAIISNITGTGALAEFTQFFGADLSHITSQQWFIAGSVLQLILSAALIALAVKHTGPKSR